MNLLKRTMPAVMAAALMALAVPAGAQDQNARVAQPVGHTGGQGRLGADDDELDGVFVAEIHHCDAVLDIEVTPNRPDCLSVLGIAHEVAALTGERLRRLPFRGGKA